MNELVERDTVETLVRVYRESEIKIRDAYAKLTEAQKALRAAYCNDHFEVMPERCYGHPMDKLETVCQHNKQRAWSVIMERTGLRKILSIKRREELDKQLYEARHAGELPEITEENILALIQDSYGKAADYANEAVYEVYDKLRPWRQESKYKTNERWKLGNKVVLSFAVERSYGRPGWHVRYGREKDLAALDNVFHMLDGRGPLKGYRGPLLDTIGLCTGDGETDFFKFKCFKNSNLHLQFKRTDLVDRINVIAGNRREVGN